MGKKIELTYKSGNEVVVENCFLCDDDDELLVPLGPDGELIPLMVITNTGVGNVVSSIAGGRVMFEDEDGLFGLDPEDIVEIKEID